ncbi:MAG: glucose 1-dehydrogenase [Acidimicrobiia bacterium]|nr:glucose 1-dehydrogenase [Acidimicrobiia bacterium]
MSNPHQTSLHTARHPELSGRVAVVTGAAAGIGEGVARRLAAEAMSVVLADIDAEKLDHTTSSVVSAGATAMAVHADLSDVDGVDALFAQTHERFGKIDLLVNNAADLRRHEFVDAHDALLEHQLATNVRGPYLCAQRAAVAMKEIGGGSIINISSVGGVQAHQTGNPYDLTKGAIDSMTRAMAVELGQFSIRVNAIGPGVTSTHRSRSIGDGVGDERIPLRRFGTVDDIAAMVAFLASDEAAYVTGQILYVDGGITAQLSPPATAL